jgi:hypothetical protein
VPKALPPGFIIEKDYTAKLASKVERFNGCRVRSATLTLNQEGYIDLSVDVSGKRYDIYSAVLDATLTDPGHEGWVGFQGIVKLDGTQIGGVMSGSITVDNEMDTSLYAFPERRRNARRALRPARGARQDLGADADGLRGLHDGRPGRRRR